MPEGAGGTEPRTWTIVVCPECGIINEPQELLDWVCDGVSQGSAASVAVEVKGLHPPAAMELVRVVEQQPPTEGHLSRIRGNLAGRDLPAGPPLDLTEDCPACGHAAHGADLCMAVIGAASPEPCHCSVPPGPPEPTQGNEWDRATVDAGVEALGRERRRADITMRDLVSISWALEFMERFKGAARDTGGRDDG